MINHWELTNRIDHTTGVIHYTLLTDGTEQDARLIARKLKGYVKGVTPAQAPHVYAFELPCDLDEGTQDKLRTAVEEGVALTNKVNELIPGGSLGNPLFSANTLSEENDSAVPDKRMELDLSAVNTSLEVIKEPNEIQVQRVAMDDKPENATVKPASPQEPQLSTVAREVFATRHSTVTEEKPVTATAPATSRKTAKPASTISISDQDMLLKDMEGSVLGKMPLEDILSADTKLDMFVDIKKNPQPIATTPADRSEQLSAAADPEAFNVFEPEITDAENLLDVAEIHTITDKITQKNMDFINEPKKPGDSQLPSVPQEGTNQAKPAQPAVPPVAPHAASPESDSLPEITLRQPKNESLESLPDLPPAPANPAPARVNTPAAPARPQPSVQQPPQKPVLRVRKPAMPAAPAAAPSQDAEKTVLRLRRKEPTVQNTNTDTDMDPATATHTQVAQPLHSTMSPERAAENLRLAKDKAIDHSIEIPISELKKHNWPLEVPLVPTYTMGNMVMSVNRFAHATAISVIDNPGKLYNPLVLHGGTGTGKTHFLNALAYSFSQKFGQEHIFMTNGVRLSRGIQRYVMEGNIAKFEDFMESVKVLLIDDIHLLAINEQNRESVSKLLHSFLRNQKQIVITSKYPPESLSKLEELINFRLDAGWISELKQATGATHFRIVKKMLIENGVDLNDKQIEEFFGGNHMTLGTVMRSIRRLKVLENLLFKNLEQDTKSQAGIFEKLLATKGEDPSSELTTKDPDEIVNITPTGNGEWGRIGIFYPQNCSNMMSWIVYALGQRAKELNIPGGFDIVVRSSYATENIISSAFKIANLCDNKKLKGAIILGPQPTACDPSVRENFYDILTHMLEIMLIRCGIINFESVRLPSTYVKLISELMR